MVCDQWGLFFEVPMSLFRGSPKAIVTLAVASAMIVQALLSSFNFGAHAAEFPVDALSTLCLSGASGERPSDTTLHHSDCCILCSVPGLDAGVGSPNAINITWSRSSVVPPRDILPASGTIERLPGLARAPPATS